MTEAMTVTHLDAEITAKAVNALFKFQEKKLADEGRTSLVGFYAQPVLATISLNQAIKKVVIRPRQINIPHSLFDTAGEEHTICFFCRSADKKSIDEYLVENPIDGLTKIISLDEVRKYYKAFKDLKSLLTQHSHFICDANIMTQLYNLLGKTFSNHRQPIPVAYKSPEKLSTTLLTAVSATYMKMRGHTISIRVGLTSMKPEDVIANALQGLETACMLFDNSWDSVKSINLATSNSPSLPIYNKIPTALSGYVNGSISVPSIDTKTEVVTGKKRKASEKTDDVVPSVVSKGKKGKIAIEKEVTTPVVVEKIIEEAVKKPTSQKKKAASKPAVEVVVADIAPSVTTTATPSKKKGRPAKSEIIAEVVVAAKESPVKEVSRPKRKAGAGAK